MTLDPASQDLSAIVTDGLWRKSLSAIRSLGKAGFHVTVMGESWFTTGFWSRFARKKVLAPTAARDAEAFGQALLRTLKSRPGSVLLPMEDATLAWISSRRSEVESLCRVLLPPEESLKIAQDKGETLRIAEELGLPCPGTWRPASAGEFADRIAALEVEGKSFAVKPRSGSGSAGVAYGGPGGASRPRTEWLRHWEAHGAMLVQERIPATGRGLGVSLLFDANSQCIAAFAHERLEQYPLSGGPSTDRRSVLEPELVDQSIRLLRKLRWRGIAMVEWKADPRDGKPKLMEINPRFWGSLELAVRSGINFPALYARAALGLPQGLQARYPNGVRCRWMIPGEILRYFSQKPEKREGLRKFLSGLPGLAEEWDPRDLPGSLATVVCTAAFALNPRYWKYVRRG